jgi:hypothetical protein
MILPASEIIALQTRTALPKPEKFTANKTEKLESANT